jgi:hypothetical protein
VPTAEEQEAVLSCRTQLLHADTGASHMHGQLHAAVSTAAAVVLAWVCVQHAGLRDDPLPATGSFALRLVKNVRCCPVLVVKANSKGPYIRATSAALGESQHLCRSIARRLPTAAARQHCVMGTAAATSTARSCVLIMMAGCVTNQLSSVPPCVSTLLLLLHVLPPKGLKVMVECRSTSRHMLTWLMDQMDAEKDSIFLAVTKAQDEGTDRVSETVGHCCRTRRTLGGCMWSARAAGGLGTDSQQLCWLLGTAAAAAPCWGDSCCCCCCAP